MSISALIEVGTEELPVVNLDVFSNQGAEWVRKALTKNRLNFGEVRIGATPRRLAIFIENLDPRQREERSILMGPAQDKAYDASGKPTPALLGFLNAQCVSLQEVRIQETPRGRYAAIEKIYKGEATSKILPKLLTELLSSFLFPKTMYWEKSGFRFPRPIRWIVALYGKNVISLTLAGVKSGRVTRGHRFLAAGPVSIPQADWRDYGKRLKARHVILSGEERETIIRQGLKKKFRQKEFDPELVHEAANLVEEPFLIQGKFSGTYRDLPEEVLATCMKKYQKIFACRDEQGNLMNRFVVVLNGRRAGLSQIQQDFENVLESRLRDAQYFYEEDTKESLEKKVPRLKELVFLGRLGTVEERTARLRDLVKDLAELSGNRPLEQILQRVAFLSKADLTTHMVREFPELQGIMGREYAEAAGEPADVARAISEQYLPKNLAEDYRGLKKKLSVAGALFGVADRIDLLVGVFAIRLDPTGSEDPYALRRAGGILVKLVRSFSFPLLLSELVKHSHAKYKVKLDLSSEEVLKKLVDFLKDRVAFELQVKPGTRPHEILQGVMKSSFNDLTDVTRRFEALAELSAKDPKVFFKTSKVVERTSNILKGAKEALNSVDAGLFQEPLEKRLYELLQQKEVELRRFLEERNYEKMTRAYGETFFEPLHDFFDRVMVNVEDASLRRNRQALMKQINGLYTEKVADLSFLTQVREEREEK